MDGVLTDFQQGYKNAFDRDCKDDDVFTIGQNTRSIPYFFRTLPVLERGKQLYDRLIKKYQVIFLTTPTEGMEHCKSDKLQWLKEHICENPTVIFSSSKADYAQSSFDILIDDMDYNLFPFAEAGGTAIDFNKFDNNEIMALISETINPQEEIRAIKEKLRKVKVEEQPTEKQKETGNYKKGKIVIKGIPITIENVPGSIRFGFDFSGRKWLSKLKNYYGYFDRTEGNDGDQIDVFISENNLVGNKVFIINQMKDGLFDEIKVVMGAKDINDARNIYLQNYEKGFEKNIHSIVSTNTKVLRDYLKTGIKTEPFRGKDE
jgi:5'(3')-deoxyribonucleotidase